MSTDSNKYKFQKLTPTVNADIKVYREALDFVFDKANGLRNVATQVHTVLGKVALLRHTRERKTIINSYISRLPILKNGM